MKKKPEEPLLAYALIDKVQNLKDGGFRITLDFLARDHEVAEKLLKLKLTTTTGQIAVAFSPIESTTASDINLEGDIDL